MLALFTPLSESRIRSDGLQQLCLRLKERQRETDVFLGVVGPASCCSNKNASFCSPEAAGTETGPTNDRLPRALEQNLITDATTLRRIQGLLQCLCQDAGLHLRHSHAQGILTGFSERDVQIRQLHGRQELVQSQKSRPSCLFLCLAEMNYMLSYYILLYYYILSYIIICLYAIIYYYVCRDPRSQLDGSALLN